MINYGVGFRQFYDISVVANGNGSEMDWGWIEVKLQELGLFDYTKNCCAFCEKWFQVQMPLSSPSVEEKFYQEATEKIFVDGVFGFEDHTNKENFAVNAIRFSDNSHGISMLVAALRKIFPSYETLTANKKFAFLRGKPFLLPIAWIYRFLTTFSAGKVKSRARSIKASFVTEDAIEKRTKMLDKWGL